MDSDEEYDRLVRKVWKKDDKWRTRVKALTFENQKRSHAKRGNASDSNSDRQFDNDKEYSKLASG